MEHALITLLLVVVLEVHGVAVPAAGDRKYTDLAKQRSVGVACVEELTIGTQRPPHGTKVQPFNGWYFMTIPHVQAGRMAGWAYGGKVRLCSFV